MFEDSLLESGGRLKTKRGRTTTFAIILEIALIGVMVLMPLIFALSIQEHELGAATRGGSDNCIAKTPSLSELAALIKTALRRVELREADAPQTISIREIELDPIRRTVRKRDHILHLSPKEFDLLHY